MEVDEEQLRHLQHEIDAARERLPDARVAHRAHFIDSGEERTDLVDDTIVPPC
jgi:hypothetical protein